MNQTIFKISLVVLAVILTITFVPIDKIKLANDFKFNLEKREEVVKMVKSGEIDFKDPYDLDIALPFNYTRLSEGGDIWVEGESEYLSVLFFTFRGLVDSFEGIIYKENNEMPTSEDFGCGTILESKKFADHWFWIACT